MSADFREGLAAAKSAISRDAHSEAYRILRGIVSPEDDFVAQSRVAKLCSSINFDQLGLKKIRIAFLASTTVDHFADILRFWLAREGIAAEIWIAAYDTTNSTILDPDSELYSFRPDLVWIFSTHRDVRIELIAGDADSVPEAISSAVAESIALWNAMQSKMSCMVLHNNADIPAEDPFGNFAGQAAWTRRNALRRYNLDLAAAAPSGVVIFDFDHVASSFGRARWVDWRYWYHSKHAFTFDACGRVAFEAARLISAIIGQAKKCLVLDLDNTLWGGVIGDDGLPGIKLGNGADGEAFVDFQRYVLALKERGILLAICSKNDEETAKEPFIKHPDMQIRLEDVAVFRANWGNKVDNIREIARVLNIGLDALVFVDDNPVERNLVREYLPMVAVPEMPQDPSAYVHEIEKQCYFETIGFSAEDRERAKYYRDNAARVELLATLTDTDEYLRSLKMMSERGELDDFHLPRMAQLINKSNQFHLTGTRYSEAALRALAGRENSIVRYFKLSDKFGESGLISVVVLLGEPGADLHIDTWVMSCRVLGRTMEEFICNDIIETGARLGCRSIVGRYVPSAKNKMVSQLYPRLGFAPESDEEGATTWRLAITPALNPLKTAVAPAI